jgi:hypothetical protein
VNDYVTITTKETSWPSNPMGEWWKQPPHILRKETYAAYRGAGLHPTNIEDNVVVPTGKRAEWYEPTEQEGLLEALFDVAQGRRKPTSFADQFGLLGYNYIVPEENQCKGGDPLRWFVAEAHTVYVIAILIGLVERAKESYGGRRELATYLGKEIPHGPYAFGGHVVQCWCRGAGGNPVLRAKGILQQFLNVNLGDTARRLQRVTRNDFRSVFTFRALVQVIYWKLADQVGGSSICRCRECGRIFISQDSRLRFCAAEVGKTISPCKSRWNVRAHRKKIKKYSTRRKG